MSWLRGSIDFGMPGRIYTLGMRSVLGKNFHEVRASMEETSHTDDPKRLEALCLSVLRLSRPELDDSKWIIQGMTTGLVPIFPQQFEIFALHPDLPRVMQFGQFPKERLETCGICHKPLPNFGEAPTYRRITKQTETHVEEVEVCSPECLTAPLTKKEPASLKVHTPITLSEPVRWEKYVEGPAAEPSKDPCGKFYIKPSGLRYCCQKPKGHKGACQ